MGLTWSFGEGPPESPGKTAGNHQGRKVPSGAEVVTAGARKTPSKRLLKVTAGTRNRGGPRGAFRARRETAGKQPREDRPERGGFLDTPIYIYIQNDKTSIQEKELARRG